MLSILLQVLLLPLLCHADVSEKISLGRSLTKEEGCKFKFEKSGKEYDLCPLFSEGGRPQGAITWDDKTPPTKSETEIRWNFAGPLDRIEGHKESDQCPEGTWICMKVTNRKLIDPPEVPPRITKLIPIAGELTASSKHSDHQGHNDEDEILEDTKVDITASLEPPSWSKKGKDLLYLRLHGGTYVQAPQYARITMLCDSEIEEPTTPQYRYSWNGTYAFEWRTKHACYSRGPIKMDPTPTPGGGKENDETDRERLPNDEGDSLAPSPRTSSAWKITGWIIACALIGGILFHLARNDRIPIKRIYPALRTFAMYHPLAPLYRRFTFRVGESGFGILRWARRRAGYESVGREQMLFDSELDETGDWINGRTVADEDQTVVGDDEVLPVTSPSPRKSSFGIKSYGTR